MKTQIATKFSASVLALTIATGASAQDSELSPEMMQFLLACEQGGALPGTLTCDLVDQARTDPSLVPQVMAAAEAEAEVEAEAEAEVPPVAEPEAPAEAAEPATPAEPPAAGEAPAAEAPAAEAEAPAAEAEAPAAEAEAPAAEAEAPAAEAGAPAAEAEAPAAEAEAPAAEAEAPAAEAEAPAAEAEAPAAEAEAPAAEAEAPAAEAEAPAAEAEAPAAEAEAPAAEAEADAAAEAEAPAAEADAEAQAEAQSAPPAEPVELDPQAQADAVAEQEAAPAAAAAADPEAEAERVEETVTEEGVRRSDEDFDTSVTAAPAPAARDEDDDDDEMDDAERLRRTLGTAAAVGLGAVVLNEILDSNDRVVTNSGDRIVVERDGQYRVLRNDDVLLRRPGANVETYRYDDGSTRAVVTYEDGSVVETVRAADGRVLRRLRTLPDGSEVVLFDDTQQAQQVVVNELPQVDRQNRVTYRESDADGLARALAAQQERPVDRTFSLNQVRNIDQVRYLVPEISVNSVNFQTGSAAIRPAEAEALAALGNAMRDAIRNNPSEVFLIEGHTDAVGNYAYNLALSDRRAESVALALTEYFQVPPENMVLQGYGESDLLVETQSAEAANRRVAVRRITPLLQSNTASR
jgi:outer membrane protein OmpA-like peptidoglycan-associated protein